MKSLRIPLVVLLFPFFFTVVIMAAAGSWLHKVPAAEHHRQNPLSGDPQAVAAGRLLFAEHCAKCHGSDAKGRYDRPSLRSQRVASATDGDLAWLLRNGSLRNGMPSWSSLPEPERWQLIAFLRNLPSDTGRMAGGNHP